MSYTSTYTGAQIDAGISAANTAVQPAGSITGSAGSVKSNATTGVMQVTGPAAASTRVMTVPDANFTAARTDAAQTFTGQQTFNNSLYGTAVLASVGSNDSGQPGGTVLSAISKVANGGGSQVGKCLYASAPYDGSHASGGYYPLTSYGLYVDDIYSYYGANAPYGSTWGIYVKGGAANYIGGNLQLGDNLVIGTSGKGIDFSATGDATGMTSELLADYEEGTWTPSIGGSTTYSTQVGYYTRIGRQVTVQFVLSVDQLNTPAGNLISGLPYASKNITNFYQSGSVGWWSGANTPVCWVGIVIYPNASTIALTDTTGAMATPGLEFALFKNGAAVFGTATYFV